jgi:hypothetical protein
MAVTDLRRTDSLNTIDLAKFNATPLQSKPYEHLIVEAFVNQDQVKAIQTDYPKVGKPGSWPLPTVDVHGAFKTLIEDMQSDSFRRAIEDKFDVDLTGRPTMFTVRDWCRATDGKIHTDSKTKIITVLVYLNDAQWGAEGGRLRVLRSGTDLNDYAAEVSPNGGTLLAFKRSDNSWHGHEPFEGQRRTLQMNWVTDEDVVRREQDRHTTSAFFKKTFGGLFGGKSSAY